MQQITYPSIYYKYPTKYIYNPDLYGSRSIDMNACALKTPAHNPFGPDPNVQGDVSLCRVHNTYRCGCKPYFGGASTCSFPNGLKYQDLPYFNPNINENGSLTLTRPKKNTNDYDMMHGF